MSGQGTTVLVTGGSGFIGGWVIIKLLEAGYTVKTTIRSLKKQGEAIERLKHGGATNLDHLTFMEADLTSDAGWPEAVEGCKYVLHVASPFPPNQPKHEDELIKPAREGTLRVLRAARDASVSRVVVTSSFAAVGYGHADNSKVLTEEDWSVVDGPGVAAYHKSKTLAEKAAWDFIEKEGGSLELAVVNPVGVFGPVLGADYATSILIVQKLLKGEVPGNAALFIGTVDVRDVADLHLLAMTRAEAKGQRFICCDDSPKSAMVEFARILKSELPAEATKKVPTRELPNFLIRIVSFFDPSVALIIPELGIQKKTTNEKAKRVLGWKPRPKKETVIATAESLIELKLV